MKLGIEKLPSNPDEAQEVLDVFREHKIEPPQRIKDIILNAIAGGGWASSAESNEFYRYLEEVKVMIENEPKGGGEDS